MGLDLKGGFWGILKGPAYLPWGSVTFVDTVH